MPNHQRGRDRSAPRVHITYPSPDGQGEIELPFIIGVLAGLSGSATDSLAQVAQRDWKLVDAGSFDSFVESCAPRVAFTVPNRLTGEGELAVDLAFSSLDDFGPGRIACKVPALDAVLASRNKLCEILSAASSASDSEQAGQTKAAIAEVDERLSRQINEILHHSEFQALEGAWRGLAYLVRNTETSDLLQIQVLNISKSELADVLCEFKGNEWRQSPVFQKIYTRGLGVIGGQPFGCLIGDYYFDRSPKDGDTLAGMERIAAAAHAPFISAAAPKLLGLERWADLNRITDVDELFAKNLELARWRSLRQSADARYLALVVPRMMARLPYVRNQQGIKEFAFEEDFDPARDSNFVWTNSAYAYARNIARAFSEHGWFARIRGIDSGGLVENLPLCTFQTSDGCTTVRNPTEVCISDLRLMELTRAGLIPFSYILNSPDAVFMSANSLCKPKFYGGAGAEEANAGEILKSRLDYVIIVGRFVHHLRAMTIGQIGNITSAVELEKMLNDWLQGYVDPNYKVNGNFGRATRPLKDGSVTVRDLPGRPGRYDCVMYIEPHYQLEELPFKHRFTVRIF